MMFSVIDVSRLEFFSFLEKLRKVGEEVEWR